MSNGPVIDTSRPHSARMYDHYLGGKDHFPVDAEAAEKVAEAFPGIFTCAREVRHFMHRATRHLAREHGIRQWIDIGTGIPTEPNLHQVAQSVAPDARIVYADNDPLVLKYAERLMLTAPEGRTAYVHADVREPDALFDSAEVNEVLDLSRPVALSLNALLHFIPDAQDGYGLVDRLMARLAPGSALALSHVTSEFEAEPWQKVLDIYTNAGTPVQWRSQKEGERFFQGMELVGPGITVVHRWHPELDDRENKDEIAAVPDAEVAAWGGVAIKR